ncbi:hypothetical protein MNVI_16000 [Mycobacterium noviomagense]|uniref:Uncharacterized protein n=1 Tax=Mycobacterium noviomagense TaxID=459858 RepID=A0A7I7PCJ3_9MYCO|nr:hypothetical protein MNVI_16000 [Mycobacterium noviomagense]
MRFQNGLRIRSVGDRRKADRFGEANQLRWDGHAHVVPTLQELTANSDARFDIATASPARQHKSHYVIVAFHCPMGFSTRSSHCRAIETIRTSLDGIYVATGNTCHEGRPKWSDPASILDEAIHPE